MPRRADHGVSFSGEWWRITLASIGDAVIATDAQGRVAFLNSVAESLTGWRQAEAQGRPLQEVFVIVNEITGARAADPVARVLQTGHVIGLANSTVLISKTGRNLPIDDSASPIRDENGGLIGVVLIFRDITERRRTEATRSYLAAIVESSDDAIIGKTLEGVITSWNKGAEKVFGYTAQEAIGRSITMLIPPDRLDEEEEILEKLKRGERIDHYETFRVRKDNSTIAISLSVSPIKDTNGQTIGASKIARDITEKRRAEEALRIAEEQLRLITDSMAASVTRCSRDLRYVWVSPGYARWLRRRPEEIEGRLIKDVIGAEGYEIIRPHIERVLAGHNQDYEALVSYEGHGSRWIHAVDVPTKDDLGFVNGWVAVVTDLTDRKRMEQEREHLLERERDARGHAEEASRLKDEFLATISHELRTPLNAILGWSRLLRAGGLGEKQFEMALQTIDRNAKTQAELIEDLLDVSRIISGKLRLDVRQVMVASVIESAVTSVSPSAEAKGVRLQTILDPNAGPVSGDAGRLQQVVWNLLSNAIKFTPRGGRVQIRVERINSHIEITVSDTGQGIKPEFLPYVFDRFRQAEGGTTRQHAGLGLGLAIVRHLVELHGGTVTADSPGEDKGATFIVRLPVMGVQVRQDQEERIHSRAETNGSVVLDHVPNLTGVRVLIVDDDADTRSLLRAVLEQCGAEVRDAGSARLGLNEVKEWKPSVVVSDIGMPEEDGYRFIQNLRNWERQMGTWTPAVALTAYARAEDRLRALASGYQIHVRGK